VDPVPVNIVSILRDVVQLVSAPASKKGLSLRLEIEADLPTIVRTDPLRLRQILSKCAWNVIGLFYSSVLLTCGHSLASNAVKFTHKGGVVVRASTLRREGNVAILRVAVIDTGIGIPGDYASHIFDKFTQADTRSTRRFGGACEPRLLANRV
jgi:signal transduction histidine kinase